MADSSSVSTPSATSPSATTAPPSPSPRSSATSSSEGVLADQVGLDFFGVGEHHRPDFAVSAPDVVLTAIAARTERIRLGSAVTVLSSDDPIRVFQRFATLDAVSSGRAEVILGRGSFIESFPLFGYDLGDYERLFTEKLDLFAALLPEQPVTWSGTHARRRSTEQRVYPTTEIGPARLDRRRRQPRSRSSARRATGCPLVIAIIGGPAERFVPLADLYRRALGRARPRRAARSPCTRPGTSPTPTRRRASRRGRTTRSCTTASARERGWGPT